MSLKPTTTLEKLYCDTVKVERPFDQGINGFLFVTDGASRYRWIICYRYLKEVPKKFVELLTMLRNDFAFRTTCVHSHNGTEFKNATVLKYFKEHGVIVECRQPEPSSKAMECTKRGRYIDVNYHYVLREFLKSNIKLSHVSSEENLADLLTKVVKKEIFKRLAQRIFDDF